MMRVTVRPFVFGVAVLLGAVGAASQGQPSQAPQPSVRRWLIAPSGTSAEIDANTSVADLEKRFGSDNVRKAQVNLGEGEMADGTIVYPDAPVRRVEVVWKDESRHGPASVRLAGARSDWGIAPGISLGTSLKEIERLNGGAFTLTGFAYDYSGTIIDWKGGRLSWLGGGIPHTFIRLQPGSQTDAAGRSDEASVLGDRTFSSALPAMQRLNPRVYALVVSYEHPSPVALANPQMEPTHR